VTSEGHVKGIVNSFIVCISQIQRRLIMYKVNYNGWTSYEQLLLSYSLKGLLCDERDLLAIATCLVNIQDRFSRFFALHSFTCGFLIISS